MGIIGNLNDHEAIVQSVSNDKTEITLLLPKGGITKAKNEGFEVGDHICFLLDPSNKRITKVVPKLVADLIVEVGSDPLMRASLQEAPIPEEEDLALQYDEEDTPIKAKEEGYDESKEKGNYRFVSRSNPE